MKYSKQTSPDEINPAQRDGNQQSPWEGTLPETGQQPEHIAEQIFDVLIIGGGITGMTTALMLQKTGKKCMLAEAYIPGFGTTGGTSAHINTFADTTYNEAAKGFGQEGAQLFADAVSEGFAIIRENVNEYKIDCDYEVKQGYVYAEDEDQVKQLQDIYEGAVKVGIPVNFSAAVPTPVAYKEGLIFDEQAQFHPLKYLAGLQKAYLAIGGVIEDHTRITGITSEEGIHTATADGKEFSAKHVVYATHIPPGLTIFNFRCAPYRSYVLGVTLKDNNYPDALIYDMQEPYHYFRTHEINGQRYLIAGGNDHKTGHNDPRQAFTDLERYLRKHYDVNEVVYKWSSQYYVPVDGLPYIGRMSPGSDSIYCATGYNGNGMMLGSVAASMLSDIITGKESKYTNIFNPLRSKPVAGFSDFIKENADAVFQFVTSQFTGKNVDSLGTIRKGSGKIVDFEGHKLAVYRDELGAIHALNPVCTHAKCIVNWNSEEKTWDCPCHGARYSIDGEVLNGPADRDLEKITF